MGASNHSNNQLSFSTGTIRYYVIVGDSIEEVHCDLVVKLSGNIVVHALIESSFYLNVEVNFSLILLLFRASIFQVKKGLII